MGLSGRFATSKKGKYSQKKGANKISVLSFAVIFTLAIFTSATLALTVNDIANSLQNIFQPTQTQATIGGFNFLQWLQNVFPTQLAYCSCSLHSCSSGCVNSGNIVKALLSVKVDLA